MQEWLNWPLSKSGEPATVPRVRIPLSPPSDARWSPWQAKVCQGCFASRPRRGRPGPVCRHERPCAPHWAPGWPPRAEGGLHDLGVGRASQDAAETVAAVVECRAVSGCQYRCGTVRQEAADGPGRQTWP
jgi:hypothetical protein